MSHISTELDLLIQSLLGNDLNTKFLNILETPEHWNYQYFLALLPLLGDVDRLAILAPEAVAKGSPKDKKEDRPPRLNLLAKNILDSVILLPDQLTKGIKFPVTLMLFDGDKENDTILFINASSNFNAEHSKEVLKEALINKLLSTYLQVRRPNDLSLNEKAMHQDLTGRNVNNGVIIKRYAYLATLPEIVRKKCSVSPADYVC